MIGGILKLIIRLVIIKYRYSRKGQEGRRGSREGRGEGGEGGRKEVVKEKEGKRKREIEGGELL